MRELQKHVLCIMDSSVDRGGVCFGYVGLFFVCVFLFLFFFFYSFSAKENRTSGLRFLDYDAININGLILFSCIYCFDKAINPRASDFHPLKCSGSFSFSVAFLCFQMSLEWWGCYLSASVLHAHMLTLCLFHFLGFLVVTALSRRIHKILHAHIVTTEQNELVLFFT